MTSLNEYAAEHATRPGPGSYIDTLPAEVQTQLLESTAGHAVATRWLHEQGHERATQQMVAGWRRKNGWVAHWRRKNGL